MMTVLKAFTLFVSILVIMPVVFFFFVASLGNHFAIPTKNQWLERFKRH